jgi:hypothetical protein
MHKFGHDAFCSVCLAGSVGYNGLVTNYLVLTSLINAHINSLKYNQATVTDNPGS